MSDDEINEIPPERVLDRESDIWRADLKHDAIEDLEKAAWYINREIQKRKTHDTKRNISSDSKSESEAAGTVCWPD